MSVKKIIASALTATAVTGFGAMPSKPDFAFPKTVSKDAEQQLKSALKDQNGPAIVRSLLDYGLAQSAINPDKLDAALELFTKTAQKVHSPATKAMIQLAKADALGSDSLTLSAIADYGEALKSVPTQEWRGTVEADSRFFPTLYDFAVAMVDEPDDSLRAAALAYNADRPYPRIYLELRNADDFEDYMRIYRDFASTPAAGVAITELVAHTNGFEQRREVYDLLSERAEPASELKEARRQLTNPDISIDCNNIVGRGKKLEIKVRACCLTEATLQVRMTKPRQVVVKSVPLTFSGTGVFKTDSVVEIQLDEFGEYEITPLFASLENKRRASNVDVTVTDFLLSRQRFGNVRFPALALDVINGAEQTGVKFVTVKNRLYGQRGADLYSPGIYDYTGSTDERTNRMANILTDRAIYHPGDTLWFAATLMKAVGTQRSLCVGEQVAVVLRNANYQAIDTLTLVSDMFGRVSGEFALPKDGLTGNFRVVIEDFSSTGVMVTDYKAPTFDAKLTATRIDSTTVEFSGEARGFNGFPIANGQVALTVRELPEWVWYRMFRLFKGDEVVATDTVSTDSEGRFSARLNVPAGKNLSASATVTSPAGESHDASAFVPFFRYSIESAVGEFTEAGKVPPFKVTDAEGKPANVDVKVLLNDSITPAANWADVPSGRYTVKVTATDAAPLMFETVVYRPTDAEPPVESALFVPVTEANPGDRLLVGTSYGNSHIYMVIWTPDSILEQRLLTPARGNFFIDIPELPARVDNARLTLHTLRNYRFSSQTVNITRRDALRDLRIEIESMRDRITPGDTEKWTIKVTDNLGNPAPAAVMLNVYSKALDAIQPYSWGFNLPGIYGSTLHFNEAASYLTGVINQNHFMVRSGMADARACLNLWGQHWPYVVDYAYGSMIRPTMNRMMKLESSADCAADMECEEAVVEELAAGGIDNGVMASGSKQSGPTSDTDAYRLPEVAVAMWRPVLTTAADGSMQVEFTAPNANTTWVVKTLAYNKELLNGKGSAEIVASKPVMVQPQLPRFLRVGDRIQLRAMVMNSTDSAADIASKIELFDPATGKILACNEFSDSVGASASTVIAMDFKAPQAAMVGVRVRATAGAFTDGEQSIIPILPAEVDVRTGTPLFLPSDSTSAVVNVPKGGVLTFTANAAWECVTALPGLLQSESIGALSSVASLFSAATARGLLRDHPEIGVALHHWQDEDSVLISNLLKNEDLKIALLSSTPFVNAAQNETDRRARLTLLFNSKEVNQTIGKAVDNLSKLVRDGGLAWTPNCDEPSEWITLSVMHTLGSLKRMGYLPADAKLNRIIKQSLEYLDREVARAYAKDKNATFEDYVMMRAMFPEVRQSAPARRAAAATVQHLVGNWRDLSLGGMARAAIILNENNYPTTARKLLESLRQHEAWAQMPLSPDLLNAFALIEPDSAEVNIIRNEYIARKQSTDWGTGLQVSALVAAILNSGSTWLVPAANQLSVKVDGTDSTAKAEQTMGQFRLDLPQGGKVEIAKGAFPAWGGVFSASTDSITNVEAFSSDKLKVTRTISGKFAVGEKVKLTLEIDAAQDMDYVVVTQPRCAGLEPVDQLPSTLWLGYLRAYREPCATVTNWFFNRLAKGITTIEETFYVTAEGDFILAPAEVQSQYAPEFQSHTSGQPVNTQK